MWLRLVACAPTYHDYGGDLCTLEPLGAPMDAGAVSVLGFSAVDVLPWVDGTFEVAAGAVVDAPPEAATFTITTRDPGPARIEEWVLTTDRPLAHRQCLAGPALRFPATIEVSATRTTPGGELEWFAGSGEGTVGAQGLDPRQIWITASVQVAGAPELASLAEASVPSGCDPAVATLEFAQVDLPWAPWGEGPVGSLGLRACEPSASLSLYRWGDAVPPLLDSGG